MSTTYKGILSKKIDGEIQYILPKTTADLVMYRSMTVEEKLDSITNTITELQNVLPDGTTITNLEFLISNNSKTIQDLSKRLEIAESNITNLFNTGGGTGGEGSGTSEIEIVELKNKLNTLQSQIDGISSIVSDHTQAIDKLQNSISGSEGVSSEIIEAYGRELAEINNTLTVVENNITTLITSNNNNSTEISNIKDDLSGYDKRITTNTNDIADLKTTIGNSTSGIIKQINDINTTEIELRDKITTLEEDIEALNNDISNLSNGGSTALIEQLQSQVDGLATNLGSTNNQVLTNTTNIKELKSAIESNNNSLSMQISTINDTISTLQESAGGIKIYDTTEDLLEAQISDGLFAGNIVYTKGRYTEGDGGGAYFQVLSITEDTVLSDDVEINLLTGRKLNNYYNIYIKVLVQNNTINMLAIQNAPYEELEDDIIYEKDNMSDYALDIKKFGNMPGYSLYFPDNPHSYVLCNSAENTNDANIFNNMTMYGENSNITIMYFSIWGTNVHIHDLNIECYHNYSTYFLTTPNNQCTIENCHFISGHMLFNAISYCYINNTMFNMVNANDSAITTIGNNTIVNSSFYGKFDMSIGSYDCFHNIGMTGLNSLIINGIDNKITNANIEIVHEPDNTSLIQINGDCNTINGCSISTSKDANYKDFTILDASQAEYLYFQTLFKNYTPTLNITEYASTSNTNYIQFNNKINGAIPGSGSSGEGGVEQVNLDKYVYAKDI